MPTLSFRRCSWIIALLAATLAAQAQDLHIKKNILVGGHVASNTETSIKGARERTVSQGPNGSTIMLRQCDLKRTLTLNEQAQTYLVTEDPQDENAAKAAALATGAPAPAEAAGGKIVVTTTVTDTGERKTMYGYQARHLKAKVVQDPSPDACTQVRQMFDIDGWFADVSKDQAACATFAPPVQQGNGCKDKVISRRVGSGKPGYPIEEDIAIATPDGGTMTVTVRVSELSKQALAAEMFDVPAAYRQVSSLAEMNGTAPQSQAAQPATGFAPPMQQAQPMQPAAQNNVPNRPSAAQLMTMGPAAQLSMQQTINARSQQVTSGGMAQGGLPPGLGGMQGMTGTPAQTNAPAAQQALGQKAPGKIRIGVAPPDAQLGQGNNAGADYSTPIRNAEVALMNGPAIEIAALDSHIAMQLQAEAQQKQCDFILFSSVAVKHSSGGSFGKFMKMGGMAASLTPMGAMAHGMGGAVAAQTVGMAASQIAQQQAMSQLAGFNGQIKSKDDVTVQYQLVATGQTSPVLQNTLQGKAKSDGEDVLTPLLQQTANTVLTQVSKK